MGYYWRFLLPSETNRLPRTHYFLVIRKARLRANDKPVSSSLPGSQAANELPICKAMDKSDGLR